MANNVETRTISILGETPKEQWKNAINIYRMTVQSNLTKLKDMADDEEFECDEDEEYLFEEYLDADAMRMEVLNISERLEYITNNVFYEMERLVDALFTEEQSK